jgi:hypothetical protein
MYGLSFACAQFCGQGHFSFFSFYAGPLSFCLLLNGPAIKEKVREMMREHREAAMTWLANNLLTTGQPSGHCAHALFSLVFLIAAHFSKETKINLCAANKRKTERKGNWAVTVMSSQD